MDAIERIHVIADANFNEEMDSWYYGPCDSIYETAKEFSDKQWSELIDSVKVRKDDMWRVLVAHSFVEIENRVGRSQDLVIFLYLKCDDFDDAYMIIQYTEDFEWEKLPSWLRIQFLSKLRSHLEACSVSYKTLIVKLIEDVSEINDK